MVKCVLFAVQLQWCEGPSVEPMPWTRLESQPVSFQKELGRKENCYWGRKEGIL